MAGGIWSKWKQDRNKTKNGQRVEEGLFLPEIHGAWCLVFGSWFLVLGVGRCSLCRSRWATVVSSLASRGVSVFRTTLSAACLGSLSTLCREGAGRLLLQNKKRMGGGTETKQPREQKRRGETSETRNDSAAAGRGEDGGGWEDRKDDCRTGDEWTC